jgi:hypothetical protein
MKKNTLLTILFTILFLLPTTLFGGEWTALISNTAGFITLKPSTVSTSINISKSISTSVNSNNIGVYTVIEVPNISTDKIYVNHQSNVLEIFLPNGIKKSFGLNPEKFDINNIIIKDNGTNVTIKVPFIQ